MKKTLLFGISFILLASFIFAQEQVPNGDFEEWETQPLGHDNPAGWQSTNDILKALLDTTNVLQSDDAASGNHATELRTILAMGFVAPGAITLGELVLDIVNNTANFDGGIPFTDRPLALKLSMKNYPATGDATMGAAFFTKFDSGTGTRDTLGVGYMMFPETYETWTTISIPIQYMSEEAPDTANIFFVSSNILNLTDGGKMYIDNLSFEYEAGINEAGNQITTTVFPNPASDIITLQFGEKLNAELKIFSNDGRLVYSGSIEGINKTIDVSTYSAGTYYFSVIEGNAKLSSGQYVIRR